MKTLYPSSPPVNKLFVLIPKKKIVQLLYQIQAHCYICHTVLPCVPGIVAFMHKVIEQQIFFSVIT